MRYNQLSLTSIKRDGTWPVMTLHYPHPLIGGHDHLGHSSHRLLVRSKLNLCRCCSSIRIRPSKPYRFFNARRRNKRDNSAQVLRLLGSNFNVTGGEPVSVDPVIATGYDYLLGAGSPLITQAIFPAIGSSNYSINALDDLTKPLLSNVTVEIPPISPLLTGIRWHQWFSLRGIDASAGLDPARPPAFATGLTFGGKSSCALPGSRLNNNCPGIWAMP